MRVLGSEATPSKRHDPRPQGLTLLTRWRPTQSSQQSCELQGAAARDLPRASETAGEWSALESR